MRIRLGLALCMLAGCATQPPMPAALAPEATPTIASLDAFAVGHMLCLGVEYLPPSRVEAQGEGPHALRLGDALERSNDARRRNNAKALPRRSNGEMHSWAMSSADLVGPEPGTEEMALQFLDDLLGEDRRRLRRELATPLLAGQSIDMQSPAIDLRSEEILAEDQEERLSRSGMGLLRRPFQKLLRRTPLATGVEVRFEQFAQPRETQEALDAEGGSTDLGRLMFRVRPSRSDDPIEIGYRRSGFRIATSQLQWKCSFSVPIADAVFLEVRSRQDYDDQQLGLRAAIRWDYSAATTFHLAIGNEIELAPSTTSSAPGDQPAPGSDGIMFYAVHFF